MANHANNQPGNHTPSYATWIISSQENVIEFDSVGGP